MFFSIVFIMYLYEVYVCMSLIGMHAYYCAECVPTVTLGVELQPLAISPQLTGTVRASCLAFLFLNVVAAWMREAVNL